MRNVYGKEEKGEGSRRGEKRAMEVVGREEKRKEVKGEQHRE